MSNLTLCGSKRIKSGISISDEQIWFRFSSWSKMTIQGPWSDRAILNSDKINCFYEINWKWLSNRESVENVVFWLATGQFWPKIQNPLQNKAIIKFLKNQKNSKKDFIQFAKLWMHVLDFIWSISIYSQILDPQGCLFNIIP